MRRSLGVLAVLAVACAGCGGNANKAGGRQQPKTVVLTVANRDPDPTDLEAFARALAQASHGTMRLEFKNNWRAGFLDYEKRTIDDVRAGRADMAKVSARAYDTMGVRSFQPLVAPFSVDSYALERAILHSPVAAQMLGGVERLGVRGVALLPGDMRRPVGFTRPLVGPGDYSGAEVETRPSQLGGQTFEALGATPAFREPGGDLSGFDGTENSLANIEGDQLDGPADAFALNVRLWPRALTMVMNEETYDALSDEQRTALKAAAAAAVDPSLDDLRSREDEALGVLCHRHDAELRTATSAQLDGLRAAVAPLTRAIEEDPANRDVVHAIAELRASVAPEPQPTCEETAGASQPGEATPVDGLWHMTSTAAELGAISPEGDVVPENWGDFTYAFDRGRFALTTKNGRACLWAYGTYAVKDDIVEWTVADGGGRSVTEENFFNRPGEFFTFRWSRFRDRLTLEPVKDAVSPEPFLVQPWRLQDGPPERSALATDCLPPRKALAR